MDGYNHKVHTSAWEAWEALIRRRDTDPEAVMGEFLRERGWIVERPETLSLPVRVESSGSFTEKDAFRLKLHVRVRIGDRSAQADAQIEARHADMPPRALTGAVTTAFQRSIMQELEPQIMLGFEQEIQRAKERARDHA